MSEMYTFNLCRFSCKATWFESIRISYWVNFAIMRTLHFYACQFYQKLSVYNAKRWNSIYQCLYYRRTMMTLNENMNMLIHVYHIIFARQCSVSQIFIESTNLYILVFFCRWNKKSHTFRYQNYSLSHFVIQWHFTIPYEKKSDLVIIVILCQNYIFIASDLDKILLLHDEVHKLDICSIC